MADTNEGVQPEQSYEIGSDESWKIKAMRTSDASAENELALQKQSLAELALINAQSRQIIQNGIDAAKISTNMMLINSDIAAKNLLSTLDMVSKNAIGVESFTDKQILDNDDDAKTSVKQMADNDDAVKHVTKQILDNDDFQTELKTLISSAIGQILSTMHKDSNK